MTAEAGKCPLCNRDVDVGRACEYFVCQGYMKVGIPPGDAAAAIALKADRTARGDYTLSHVGRWLGEWLVLAFVGADRVSPVFRAARRVHSRLLDIGPERYAFRVLPREHWTVEVVTALEKQADLSVPGLVRYELSGETGKQVWTAHPWLDGARPLRDLLPGTGPLVATSPDVAGRVIEGLLDVVAGLHAARTIHGALHPGVVAVVSGSHGPEVRLHGLGPFPIFLPKSQGAAPPSGFQPDDLKPYQAPEVREGREARVASDVYSLSAILVEIMTGAPRVPAKDSGLPPALIQAIAQGLDVDPRQRPASVDALRNAIFEAMGPLTTSAPIPVPAEVRSTPIAPEIRKRPTLENRAPPPAVGLAPTAPNAPKPWWEREDRATRGAKKGPASDAITAPVEAAKPAPAPPPAVSTEPAPTAPVVAAPSPNPENAVAGPVVQAAAAKPEPILDSVAAATPIAVPQAKPVPPVVVNSGLPKPGAVPQRVDTTPESASSTAPKSRLWMVAFGALAIGVVIGLAAGRNSGRAPEAVPAAPRAPAYTLPVMTVFTGPPETPRATISVGKAPRTGSVRGRVVLLGPGDQERLVPVDHPVVQGATVIVFDGPVGFPVRDVTAELALIP